MELNEWAIPSPNAYPWERATCASAGWAEAGLQPPGRTGFATHAA